MKKLGLFLSDIALLYCSLLLMLYVRYSNRDNFDYFYNIHLIPFGIIFVLWLIIFYISNLYEPKVLRNNVDFYSSLFQAILTASAISIIFFYFIPIFGITPRTNLFIFIGIFTALETLSRFLWNRLFETKFKKSVLLVGADEDTSELAEFIKNHPQLGYQLKHRADPKTEIDKIKKLVDDGAIDTVIVTPESYKYSRIINIFYKSIVNKISLYNSASFYERVAGMVLLGSINQLWFLENLGEARKKTFEIAKRVGDLILAAIFGVVSLIFYPFIILLIKVSSSGPILYRQERVGQAGKTFEIIKFRTMIKNAEQKTGAVWAIDNDPRVTAVGRFLRKTRLDEIPQLWNILRGEMSFVGPRAERPEFHELLQKNVPFYEERYLIKPGLTGWAQINFRYGSSVEDAEEKLKYDLYYIKNRSPILDLGIILKTIRIALRQAGR